MQYLQVSSILQGGKYKIEQTLGQGSFGITYLAEHTSLGRKVAIKEFFMKELNTRGEDGSITGMTDGSLSYNYGQKFKKEAMNLSQLDHPNIVRVTDSFEENGTYYYVMDYIEGENLNDYIKKNEIGKDEAVSIIKDVAVALHYMHNEKHMLHLDLKPGNIMRRISDGHIFLIDFGLSKHYSSNGQPETSTTIGLGTPGYAPVEQNNQSKNGEFRPTIDIYALGATFFKLLTRDTPPIASELISDDELIERKLRTKGVPEKAINTVVHAMLPNVHKRTQSTDLFLSELTNSTDIHSVRDNSTEKSAYTENNNDFGYSRNNEETIIQQGVEQEPCKSQQINSFVQSEKRKTTGFSEAIKKCLISKYASFKGRATRAEYWYFTLFLYIILFIGGCIGGIMGAIINNSSSGRIGMLLGLSDTDTAMFFALVIMCIIQLLLLFPSISVLVRRLHDTGRSGWWYWISFIPYIGGIIIFILTILSSQKQDNKYGPY